MNIDLINRLWEKTALKDGHWIWLGSNLDAGKNTKEYYGQVWYNRSNWIVHRLSICLYLKVSYNGNWTANHICRETLCWNPCHIYIGTHKENSKDKIKDGTFHGRFDINRNKTHCSRGHGYTERNTYYYKSGARKCRECNRLSKQNKKLTTR